MNAIDTNVLVYRLDRRESIKQAKARDLLRRLCSDPTPTLLLWQVLGELMRQLRSWQDQGRITQISVSGRAVCDRHLLDGHHEQPPRGQNRPDIAGPWSNEGVARRWWNLFPGRKTEDNKPADRLGSQSGGHHGLGTGDGFHHRVEHLLDDRHQFRHSHALKHGFGHLAGFRNMHDPLSRLDCAYDLAGYFEDHAILAGLDKKDSQTYR